MKKTLLAAALLASFAGAAQAADSSVQLYGVFTTGLEYKGISNKPSSFGFDNTGDMTMQTPRWGIKGTEDLGDGLSAIFNLEAQLFAANGQLGSSAGGTGRLFHRLAWIGLQNASWGKLIAGRVSSVSNQWSGTGDPFGNDWGIAGGSKAGGTQMGLGGVRYDNAIEYTTPSFSGLQAQVAYSFDADSFAVAAPDPVSNKQRAISAGVQYGNGPINVAATLEHVLAPSGEPDGKDASFTGYTLGGNYDFGAVKVYAGYAHTNAGVWGLLKYNTATGAWSSSYSGKQGFNSYNLGLSIPVGTATTVLAGWTLVQPQDKTSAQDNNNIFTVGAKYALSKRTNIYGAFAYETADGNVDGAKGKIATVGLNHSF